MRRFLSGAFATGILASACAPKPDAGGSMAMMAVDTAAAMQGIDSTRAHYSALLLAGDATALANLYTEDATLDLYGVPRQHGRAAIEAALKGSFGMRKYLTSEVHPIAVAVRTNQNATEIGTYHEMHDMNGKKDHEWGRYVVGINKGSDGVWRLSYLMGFPDSTKVDK